VQYVDTAKHIIIAALDHDSDAYNDPHLPKPSMHSEPSLWVSECNAYHVNILHTLFPVLIKTD